MKKPKFLTPRRKYEVNENHWLVKYGRRRQADLATLEGKAELFKQWGRMPEDWELAFVEEMRGLQEAGVRFNEVLSKVLPDVVGEAGTDVMGVSLKRKEKTDPKAFVKAVRKAFGPSAKDVVVKVGELAKRGWAPREDREETLYRSLLDAIHDSDDPHEPEIRSRPLEQ